MRPLGKTQILKALHYVTLVRRPTSAQWIGTLHHLVTVGENVVLSADCPPPSCAKRQPHALKFIHVSTGRQQRQTPKRQMLQGATVCADDQLAQCAREECHRASLSEPWFKERQRVHRRIHQLGKEIGNQ